MSQQIQDERQRVPAGAGDARTGETANGTKRWFMRGVIAATLALCVAMVWVLFDGWVKVQQPSSMVGIYGGKELAGATVTIEAFFLPKPYEIVLDENGSGRFFPQPGRYQLRVFYGESHEVAFKGPIHVEIAPDALHRIPLNIAVATTRPWLKS